jgi:hypothetical protein
VPHSHSPTHSSILLSSSSSRHHHTKPPWSTRAELVVALPLLPFVPNQALFLASLSRQKSGALIKLGADPSTPPSMLPFIGSHRRAWIERRRPPFAKPRAPTSSSSTVVPRRPSPSSSSPPVSRHPSHGHVSPSLCSEVEDGCRAQISQSQGVFL